MEYYSEVIKRLHVLVENLVARYNEVCDENAQLKAEVEELKYAQRRQDSAA